jgi:hypothetical protein
MKTKRSNEIDGGVDNVERSCLKRIVPCIFGMLLKS